MVGMGQTHIVLCTSAGSQFGFALLWIVIAAHLFTYPVFEYGPRYAMATGESLLDGYLRIGRLRKVVIGFFAFMLSTIPFFSVASHVSVTASILGAAIPHIPYFWWCVIIIVGTLTLVFAGGYTSLEKMCLVMSIVLVVITVAAFVAEPPDAAPFLSGLVVPTIPLGAVVVLVALMRLPSDAGASILHSLWALEKRDRWASTGGIAGAVKKGILDLRVGFIMSAMFAVIFLSVGATVLHPLGVELEGVDLALKLSSVYTETVGSWAFPVFILMAFLMVWGALYSYLDGVPRFAEAVIRRAGARDGKLGGKRFRSAYTLIIAVGGFVFATLVPEPMFLVVLATSVGLVGYPCVYALNIYVVMKYVDKEHRPSKLNLALAFMGVAYSVVGFVLLLLVRVFGFWS
jgi:Mn2+/Fe2+ NRAMP family transporter